MDLLPLRAAASKGSIDGLAAAQLVSAGFTLLQRCAPLVRVLAGRRSAILLPSSPQFLVALAASDGRAAVLVNPLSAAAEVAHQLRDAEVGAVFTVKALAGKIPEHIPRVLLDEAPTRAAFTVPGGDDQVVDLGTHFGMSLEGDAHAPGREEDCVVVYTSAMQGIPMGAALTHRNLIANTHQTVRAAQNSAEDHVLAVLPFSHLFGLTVSLMAPLFVGAKVTTMPRFNPINAVDLLETGGISEIVGVPAVFAGMLTAIERRGGTLKSETLRLCICGGAPLSVELQERWQQATGVELRQGYGLTEASPVALFNRVDQPNVNGTLGLPFPDVGISIRDAERSEEVPDGRVGEICVSGETVFRGYVNERGARDASRGLRTVNGWLHTGDLGLRRADGRIEFHGLLKPMFTRNGFNVYPSEIERAMTQMPGVAAARAYAIPEPARENDIGVDLVLDGTREITETDVKQWCEGRLAQYKQPSRVTLRR